MMRQAVNLKQKNPNLKVLIAIGGWGQESKRFSDMVATPETRKIFVDSVVEYITERNFDGLDMDWEYPATRGGNVTEDKKNFVLLLKV